MGKRCHPLGRAANTEDLKRVAFAIYKAAKENGDDIESPISCAKAALEAMDIKIIDDAIAV